MTKATVWEVTVRSPSAGVASIVCVACRAPLSPTGFGGATLVFNPAQLTGLILQHIKASHPEEVR